jgi:hypothetical protein
MRVMRRRRRMRKNEKLTDVEVARDEMGTPYLILTYTYEDDKGLHSVVFPEVHLPFLINRVPDTDMERRSYGPDYGSVWIPCDDRMFLYKGTASFMVERDGEKEEVKCEDVYCADCVIKPAVREMTLKEVEEKLGYKIKIVSEKKRRSNINED